MLLYLASARQRRWRERRVPHILQRRDIPNISDNFCLIVVRPEKLKFTPNILHFLYAELLQYIPSPGPPSNNNTSTKWIVITPVPGTSLPSHLQKPNMYPCLSIITNSRLVSPDTHPNLLHRHLLKTLRYLVYNPCSRPPHHANLQQRTSLVERNEHARPQHSQIYPLFLSPYFSLTRPSSYY